MPVTGMHEMHPHAFTQRVFEGMGRGVLTLFCCVWVSVCCVVLVSAKINKCPVSMKSQRHSASTLSFACNCYAKLQHPRETACNTQIVRHALAKYCEAKGLTDTEFVVHQNYTNWKE